MIKPTPIKVICHDCGFKKVFAPKSDVIMPGEYNQEFCTKCRSLNIKVTTEVSIFNQILGTFIK